MIAIPPAAYAAAWQFQTAPDCVEESVRVAVAAHEHKYLTESQIDAYAQKKGWYDPTVGTTGTDAIGKLARHYGLHIGRDGAMSRHTLTTLLGKGYSIIAAVNANTIWNPEGWTSGHTTFTADHAVTVVYSGGPWVEIIDTGIPTGAGDLIPWTTFSKAWSASGWYGVATR